MGFPLVWKRSRRRARPQEATQTEHQPQSERMQAHPRPIRNKREEEATGWMIARMVSAPDAGGGATGPTTGTTKSERGTGLRP